MSRITESLRRLIREEVQKSLRRKLREEAMSEAVESVSAAETHQGFSDDSPEYDKLLSDAKTAFRDANRVFDAAQAAYKTAENTVNIAAKTNFNNSSMLNQKAEDDADAAWKTAGAARDAAFDKREIALKHYNFVAPEALGGTPSAKRRRAPQNIVKQIQTALGMTGLGKSSIDGIWGKATDTSWNSWLDLQVQQKTIVVKNPADLDALRKNWKTGIAAGPFNGHITDDKNTPNDNRDDEQIDFDGSPESMLKFITSINNLESPPAVEPVISASAPTAEKSYADMDIEELKSMYDTLANKEKSIANSGGDHSAISAELKKLHTAINAKIVASNAAEAKALTALANNFEDTEEFNFDKDDNEDLTESRWLRLAGLLKG